MSRNLSEQTIPKKWTQIIEMKNQLKQKQKKKKKKNKTDLICGNLLDIFDN